MNEKKYLKEDLQKVGENEYLIPEELRESPMFEGSIGIIKSSDEEDVLNLFNSIREELFRNCERDIES